MSTLKLPSKLQSFEDVQRALQDVGKVLIELSSSVNYQAEGEVTDKDGKTGDTRITQNKDKSYTFEIKTGEGWKTPVIGENAVKFKGKPGERSKFENKSIDELQVSDDSTGNTIAKKTIYDEKADKFILPRPDYDSSWIDVIDQETSGTHDLGCLPLTYQVLFTLDGGTTVHYYTQMASSHGSTLRCTASTWAVHSWWNANYGYLYQDSGSTSYSISDTATTSGLKLRIQLWK